MRRGLARSRQQAAELIEQGSVAVRGVPAGKAATVVDRDTPVTVHETDERDWASRGAHKLIGALDRFGDVPVTGARCLDAGASTGGFTDVLLDRGAAAVVAVDVGYGQIVWRLRSDDRVRVHDRTNVRTLKVDDIGGPVDLTVADLSFISLRTVLPALVACTRPGASCCRWSSRSSRSDASGSVPRVVRDPGCAAPPWARSPPPRGSWGWYCATRSPAHCRPVGQRRVLPAARPRRRAAGRG